MEDGQGLIFGHVHLVQHAKAPQPGTLADGALPEGDLSILEGVRSDEGGGIHVDIHGHVPGRAAEGGGQILRQHIFACGLGAGQEQMLPAQQGGGRPLPDLLAVVEKAGTGHPPGSLRRNGVGVPEGLDLLQQAGVHPLLLQFLPNIHQKTLLGAKIPDLRPVGRAFIVRRKRWTCKGSCPIFPRRSAGRSGR